MPLLFILFFALTGASLNFSAFPALGLVGLVYILTRSGGLIIGARLGASLGRIDKKIKYYKAFAPMELLTFYCSLFTVYYSLFTIHYSLFTVHYS